MNGDPYEQVDVTDLSVHRCVRHETEYFGSLSRGIAYLS